MITYIIIALSFSLSSISFIHIKAFKKYKLDKLIYKFLFGYVLFCFILFPIVVLSYMIKPKQFVNNYGMYYVTQLKKLGLI